MSRTTNCIYILFSALVCFSLQFNLAAIFAVLHPYHVTTIRLVPYFFLGGALAPLLLWAVKSRGLGSWLPWLPPVLLTFGLFAVFKSSSTALCTVFILLVLGAVNAGLLDTLFRYPFKTTYLFDLVGGLAGFLVAVYLLTWLTGEGVYLLSLACSFVPAALSAKKTPTRYAAWVLAAVALGLLGLQLQFRAFDLLNSPVGERPADQVLASHVLAQQHGQGLLASEWTSIGRVDAVAMIDRSALFYNNRVWSQLSAYTDKPNKFTVPSPFWAGAQTAVVIGVGGGNDIQALLETGVADVTGLEINPATIRIMTKLGGQSGGIYSKAKIELTEGRAFFETVDQNYDLIMLHTADLFAPQMQANVDLESFLYTTEALSTFWDHLTPSGTLIIQFGLQNEWFKSLNSVRLLNTLLEYFDTKGLTTAEHLMVVSHAEPSTSFRLKTSMFVIKKSKITPAMIENYKSRLKDIRGLKWISDTQLSTELAVEECLNSIYNRTNKPPCQFDKSLVNRDSYPFYNITPQTLSKLGLDYYIPLVAGLLLAMLYLVFSFRWAPPSGSGAAGVTALVCGVIYGFLSPFLYYNFLLYSRSPLALLAVVQAGLLAASVAANQIHQAAKNAKLMTVLLLLSLLLSSALHVFKSQAMAWFRPSEEIYNLAIFAVVFLVAFPLSLLFQGTVHERSERIGQLTFGLNLTGLCIGSFVSYIVNLIWGLHVSFAVMAALITLLLLAIRPNSLRRSAWRSLNANLPNLKTAVPLTRPR